MGITELENELFLRWRKRRDGFVPDGVVNEDSYLASEPKLMFVMKEVNDPGGGKWDLRKFLHEGGLAQTWDNITRWVIGIRRLNEDIAWKELDEITKQQRIETLRSLCVMNLKKSPGGSTTDNVVLARTAEEDRDYLKKQFSFYDPELIICCGSVTSDLFHRVIRLDPSPNWRMTSRGIWFHEYRSRKYVLSHSHPEARVRDCLLYYGLVDAFREILQNQPEVA